MERDWLAWHTVTGKCQKTGTMTNGGVFNVHTRPYRNRPCARRTQKKCTMQIYAYRMEHSHTRTPTNTFIASTKKHVRLSFGSCLCDHIIGQRAHCSLSSFFGRIFGAFAELTFNYRRQHRRKCVYLDV